jgi:fumarylpyruvate hydrolase
VLQVRTAGGPAGMESTLTHRRRPIEARVPVRTPAVLIADTSASTHIPFPPRTGYARPMTQLIFPFAPPTVPIDGESRAFPVRRIYCVGRNYAAHAREMGADPGAEPPFFFMKPADAVVLGNRAPYPPDTDNLHHEVELVIAIGRGGWDVTYEQALDLVYGYAVGVDLTKRDRQNDAKAKGQPWERGKAFEASAPISPIFPAERIGHPKSGAIELAVNGETRQSGDLSDLILPAPALIARISEVWTLAPGDLIFTGTPEGVGRLSRGDHVSARIDGVTRMDFEVS